MASRGRWAVLVACSWLESLNGSTNVYSSYSQAIKTRLGLDQRSIGLIHFFISLGSCIGVGPSLLVAARCPVWLTVFLGLLHSSFGYLLTWLAIAKPSRNSTSGLLAICLFESVAGNAQNYVQTAAIVRCVREFPRRRGPVVGLLKGFLGVSASILVQIFPIACAGDGTCIPLLLAWLLPLLSVPSILLLVAFPETATRDEAEDLINRDDQEDWRLNILSIILIILACFLFFVLMLESVVDVSRAIIVAILLTIILFPVLVAAVPISSSPPRLLPVDPSTEPLLAVDPVEPLLAIDGCPAPPLPPASPQRRLGDDFTVAEALCSLDLWLLFFHMLLISGVASSIQGSLAQLGSSLGYSPRDVDTSVSLFSVSSCLARIGAAVTSERLLHSRGLPRPAWLCIGSIAMATGTAWAAADGPGSLYALALLAGASEGTLWCVSIASASELFGLPSFGTLLNVLTFACPPGSYIFSFLVVGLLYDYAAGSSLLCYGRHCFAASYAALAAACLLAGCLAALLASRSQGYYSKVRYKVAR